MGPSAVKDATRERATLLAILALILAGGIGLSQSAPPRPGMALEQAIQRHRVPAQVYTSSIQITEPSGEIKTRESRTWIQLTEDGSYRARIEYLSPPDIRGMEFVVTRRSRTDPLESQIFLPSLDRWLATTSRTLDYIPAARLIEQSWMLIDLHRSQFLLRGAEQLDDIPTRIMSISPLSQTETSKPTISRRLIWLSDDGLFPIQIKGFDASNRLAFTIRFKDLEPLLSSGTLEDPNPLLSSPALRARRTLLIDHTSGRRTETTTKTHTLLDDAQFGVLWPRSRLPNPHPDKTRAPGTRTP